MFEAIYGIVILCIVIYLFLQAKGSDDRWLVETSLSIRERVEKLEAEVRYVADQPKGLQALCREAGMYFHSTEYEKEIHKNDVPINDVVKAIVKHLGMEIEKVEEKTTKTPQEVKVVEKPVTGATMMGPTGVVVMPDGKGIPMPKPKRKYTRRKVKK
jgi:hypothetical protein